MARTGDFRRSDLIPFIRKRQPGSPAAALAKEVVVGPPARADGGKLVPSSVRPKPPRAVIQGNFDAGSFARHPPGP